eukprot:CAMPEP_0182464368 /NCGR_PEP_ID=MMETSP1319-20130603/8572_1 /TAXON_ID=172717 /ORGANISM="Bolidomonas pacifica, Strain RCC208" /LENGTH=139 /DNA_ID=CAMNT_0024664009 /DNA_START=190 /DNA_END=610 /DNA_ORIENTATION=+
MVYLQIGSGIEIANHFYEGNFELDEFKSDLVNGTFYYFNFGAQALMVLGLRQAGVPFFRACSAGNGEQSKWQCFAAWVGTVFDVFMVLSIPATPVVYALGGGKKLSPSAQPSEHTQASVTFTASGRTWAPCGEVSASSV